MLLQERINMPTYGSVRKPWTTGRKAAASGRYVRSRKYMRAQRRKTIRFTPGVSRTVGYYGRYSGADREVKFFDLDINDAAIAAGGTIVEDSVVGIAQGNTEQNRDGRKCTVVGIGWRWDLALAGQSNTGSTDTCRVILYLDKQCNGTAATVTQILESNDYQSFNNLANKSRFQTLMDRTYDIRVPAAMGDGTTNDAAANSWADSFYKKVNIPLEFDSTTGAITELRSNNIGVLILSKNGLTALSFNSKMRIRFTG